jgi:hypothetical protein
VSIRDEQDYLMRMIAAAVAIVARLRSKLTGVGGGSAAEVVQEARHAQSELLGKDFMLLRAMDPATAARLLGPDRIPAWVDLLRVEADALRADGKADEAAAIAARAKALAALKR